MTISPFPKARTTNCLAVWKRNLDEQKTQFARRSRSFDRRSCLSGENYACKIEETTDGRGRRAGGKTRRAVKVIAERCIQANGEIDEQKTAARFRENKAQEVAEE